MPYFVLLGGVFIVSSSSILIRLAQQEGMPSITIAAERLALAALILAPVALGRTGGEVRRLYRRDILLGVAAGILLALHLVAWTSSLGYTSVASSTALVTTNPVWVGLASWLVLRERLSVGAIIGIVVTLIGSMLIIVSGVLEDTSQAAYRNPTLGNMLALVGAWTVSGYFLIGRGLRRRLSVLAYIWLVYTSAALTLACWMWVSGGQWLGFSPLAYLLVLGLAVGPQLLGHTAFNWALAHLSATFVALAILGEPVGSALWAWILFHESFTPLQLVGFVLLLVGIYAASRYERAPDIPPTKNADPALSAHTQLEADNLEDWKGV
jgi:drug/metabolite transporter (DMT)-like permease